MESLSYLNLILLVIILSWLYICAVFKTFLCLDYLEGKIKKITGEKKSSQNECLEVAGVVAHDCKPGTK